MVAGPTKERREGGEDGEGRKCVPAHASCLPCAMLCPRALSPSNQLVDAHSQPAEEERCCPDSPGVLLGLAFSCVSAYMRKSREVAPHDAV